jgi:hypothetical protein
MVYIRPKETVEFDDWIGIQILPGKSKFSLVFKNKNGYWPIAYFNNDDDAIRFSTFLETIIIDRNPKEAFEIIKHYPGSSMEMKDDTADGRCDCKGD